MSLKGVSNKEVRKRDQKQKKQQKRQNLPAV